MREPSPTFSNRQAAGPAQLRQPPQQDRRRGIDGRFEGAQRLEAPFLAFAIVVGQQVAPHVHQHLAVRVRDASEIRRDAVLDLLRLLLTAEFVFLQEIHRRDAIRRSAADAEPLFVFGVQRSRDGFATPTRERWRWDRCGRVVFVAARRSRRGDRNRLAHLTRLHDRGRHRLRDRCRIPTDR
jgi:hypothetical protein